MMVATDDNSRREFLKMGGAATEEVCLGGKPYVA